MSRANRAQISNTAALAIEARPGRVFVGRRGCIALLMIGFPVLGCSTGATERSVELGGEDPGVFTSHATSVPDDAAATGGASAGARSGARADAADAGGFSGERDASDLAFFPDWLPNTEVGGAEGGLELIAFTLVDTARGLELYAAVRNDGTSPSCNAGLLTTFYDPAGISVATLGLGLRTGRLYRLDDASGAIISCVPPGGVAMAGSRDVPGEAKIDELGYLEHSFPAFGLDVIPLEVVALHEIEPVRSEKGTAYRGQVQNLLEVTVTDPRVDVFPVNAAGRPLGMASLLAEGTEIPALGSFAFETSAVPDSGVDVVAFATAEP